VSFSFGSPSIAVFVAAAVALAVALASLRRTSTRGGMTLTLMMLAVAVWAMGSGFESAAVGAPNKMFFSAVTYVGTVNVAPLFLVFALRYRRGHRRLVPWKVVLLWVIPAATLILAATNGSHGLLWSRVYADPVRLNTLVYEHGPWFLVAVSYFAVLGLVSAVLIARAAQHAPRTFAGQTVILLAGLAIPWLATALDFMPFNPFPDVDLPPAAFAVTGILLFIGMGRYRLLDLVPVARHLVVERMADGLIVVDAQERLVDVNPAAIALFGASAVQVGHRSDQVQGELGRALAELRAHPDGHVQITLPGTVVRYVDLRSSLLPDRRGRVGGRLIVAQDVTERRRMELEKERLIGELQAALADVKTLSGLVPICSSCKKIRDDQGYWRTLERYLADHSDAQFTHGLCDDCLRRLYPDLAADAGPGISK
jgi:PAS domain S-box-containing protein